MKIKLVELLNEATKVESPGAVLKKAQLAKTRSDMQRIGAQQVALGQSKKNTKDTTTKRRLSKQIADLGAKKADMGVKTAEMSTSIKKPQMETVMSESVGSDMEDAVLIIARNERRFYDKRDVEGAIRYAIEEYIKEEIANLREDLKHSTPGLRRELKSYWSKQGPATRGLAPGGVRRK